MNYNIATAVRKAVKMLESGAPVEAVSALDRVIFIPVDLDTHKLIEKAREEAQIGSTCRAEHLLAMIDLKIGEVVISRDGICKGKTTGGNRHCTMEGCRGFRLGVRWQDGKLTWPCTHGMNWDSRENVWKII